MRAWTLRAVYTDFLKKCNYSFHCCKNVESATIFNVKIENLHVVDIFQIDPEVLVGYAAADWLPPNATCLNDAEGSVVVVELQWRSSSSGCFIVGTTQFTSKVLTL